MTGSIRNLLYLFGLLPALLVIYGNLQGGLFTLLNLFFTLIILGILEWITPESHSNNHSAKQDVLPKLILFLHVVFQTACVLSLFYGIYTNVLSGNWIIAAALSTGLNSGASAIVIAHEFIHQKNKTEQAFGKYLLFTAGNLYFFVDHLRVHHKWVGTPKDHATARLGESLYGFFVRSVREQFLCSIKLEAERLQKSKFGGYSLKNYVVRQVLFQVMLLLLLYVGIGYWAVLAWIAQCLLANFLLEYVNYLEHYGLVRAENERATELHSWDSDKMISRFILVDLTRHADHHFYASKPFHTLNSHKNSPKLPSGYAGMFFVAAIPVLWRKVMHPRLPKSGIIRQ